VSIKNLIHKKRLGGALTGAEIDWLIDAYLRGDVADYQVAALLMAIVWRGMDEEETVALTRAMVNSGRVLEFPGLGVTADKHSTGGVGDKVSIVLAPLVAATGLPVPMLSGRGLGHTGGTLDKLESIPGFQTQLDADTFARVLRHVGCVMGGQSGELAPADGRLYALRDATATVASLPLIVSSILSKKVAAGPDVLVLDVKVGRGAFMRTREDATELARLLVRIGTRLGKKVVAVMTSMDCPLGRAVGNVVELREAVDMLAGRETADDLREVTFVLGAAMLVGAGRSSSLAEARTQLEAALARGEAWARFIRMISAQGGDAAAVENGRLPTAPVCHEVMAEGSGAVVEIDALAVANVVIELGGGRRSMSDSVDRRVGVWLNRRPGETVTAGESLMTIHAPVGSNLIDDLARQLRQAVTIGEAPEPTPLIIGVIGPEGEAAWRGWETPLPIH
jgi:pyrimidine-nucleoside phosphorylase